MQILAFESDMYYSLVHLHTQCKNAMFARLQPADADRSGTSKTLEKVIVQTKLCYTASWPYLA